MINGKRVENNRNNWLTSRHEQKQLVNGQKWVEKVNKH